MRIRGDAVLLRADRLEELQEWVKQLGVDPKDVRAKFLITMGETSYQLHLSRMVRRPDGKLVIDEAIGEVVYAPLVIDLGTDKSWPGWLNESAEGL
jgi:hypothetical protein